MILDVRSPADVAAPLPAKGPAPEARLLEARTIALAAILARGVVRLLVARRQPWTPRAPRVSAGGNQEGTHAR